MVEYSADRPIPTQNEAPVIGTAGIFTASWYSWLKRIDQFARVTINGLPAEQQVLADRVTALENASIVETVGIVVEDADDKDYPILRNMASAFEILSVATKSSAGTCTVTVKIGSTALGGTANSVSTSEQIQTHSTSNEGAIGDDVKATISSNSGAEMVEIFITYERPLF